MIKEKKRPVIVDRNGQTRLTLNCHGNKVDWEIPRAALLYLESPSGHEYVNSSISLQYCLTEVTHTEVMRSPSAGNAKATACLKGNHTSLSLSYVSRLFSLDPLSVFVLFPFSLPLLFVPSFPRGITLFQRQLFSLSGPSVCPRVGY